MFKKFFEKLILIFKDIKLAHTVFALPFALMSAFLASNGLPRLEKIFWILLAMFGARSGAMATNRLVDARLDADNPRTKERAIPSGRLKRWEMLIFIIFSYGVFVYSAYMLNSLCFKLSPVAIFIISFYSLTKRFTSLSHFVLGLSLSIAPMGAWLAIKPEFSLAVFFICISVVLWVGGFDILYSIQDLDVDKRQGLFSIPRFLGIKNSLWLSRGLHFFALLILVLPFYLLERGWFYLAGLFISGCLFVYEHSLVRADDLTRLNIAFFNMNGLISITVLLFTILDLWIKK